MFEFLSQLIILCTSAESNNSQFLHHLCSWVLEFTEVKKLATE